MRYRGIEIRKLTADDLKMRPSCFENDGDEIELLRLLNWCILPVEGEKTPHYYMRNMEPDNYRWGGIIKFGDGPLAPQTSAHHSDIAQKETVINPYHQISEDPDIYEISSDDLFTQFRYSAEKETWKETDILNLEARPFPFMIIIHPDSPQGICYWVQPVIVEGEYDGKHIKSMGAFDRFFTEVDPEKRAKALAGVLDHYIWDYYLGTRQDGRLELAYMNICKKNGEGVGVYWLEGEDPVISTEIVLEAEWHKLPYAPDSDRSVTFTNAVWRFADKEIHFIGKWGNKGHTAEPRMYTEGLTHASGIWYEGNEPYEHILNHCCHECSGGTIEKLTEMGFDLSEL